MASTRGLRAAILAIAVAAILLLPAAQTTHTVGDALGWLVPPGGAVTYKVWPEFQTFTDRDILVFNFGDGDQDVAKVTKKAFKTCSSTDLKSFKVGDTLVFNFIDGTQDVPVVTDSVCKNCTTSNTMAIYTISVATNIILETAGEHFFMTTYDRHCKLGQKPAINVTGSSTTYPPPSSPSSPSTFGPSAGGPAAPPISSAPSRFFHGCFFTSLLIAITFFHY